MNILAAHLNTSRATEMSFTNLELTDIGHQNVVYHIILTSLVLLRLRETCLCRQVFSREHLSTDIIVQYTVLL